MSPLLLFGPGAVGVPGHRPLFTSGEVDIEPGRFICLLGPNGSGKSTLLRTLTGLLPPKDGVVRLQDLSIDRMPIAARGRHFAAVFASAHLSPVVTVYDLVALGRYPYTGRRGRLAREDRAIVEEQLERLDLAPLRDRPLGQLSDGERHRAHLARGLAQGTPLLFLDEGLAFLDALWRRRILTEVEALCRAGGSVVLATQDINEALISADLLWVIDPGASHLSVGGPEDLALAGKVAEAFSQGAYHFDPETNRFEATGTPRFSFEVTGPSVAAAWTRRGLYRAGGRELDRDNRGSAERGLGAAAGEPGSGNPGPTAGSNRRSGGTSVPPNVRHVDVTVGESSRGSYSWTVEYRAGSDTVARRGATPTEERGTEPDKTSVTVSSISELVGLFRRPATRR